MARKIAFFTICSANYLSYALTLGRSLSEAETGFKLHVFLADRLPSAIAVPDDHVVMTSIDELAIDGLDDMAFRYSILELNTAIKPYCFEYLFDALHYDAAIYLDPDIIVLNSLDHVRSALEGGASCVLTPHITQSLNDGRHPSEDTFLTCDVFNLGFAAFANVPESRSFIQWWGEKTRRGCISAIDRGIFVDQSYCNFAPCFIERFHALRNPGYSVAYWNLSQRLITRDGDRYLVDGELVRFVHFSGIEPRNPASFSRHQNRFSRHDVGPLKSLVDLYVAELNERDQYGSGRFSEIPYSFGLCDGQPIDDLFRFVYRRYEDDLLMGRGRFDVGFFNEPAKNYEQFYGICISRLYATIWELRNDLQVAFNLRTLKGQADFLNWAITGVPREYGIGAPFIQSIPLRFRARNLLKRLRPRKNRVLGYLQHRQTAPPLSAGIDVYGFFKTETGVGQAGRSIVQALQQTNVRFSCHTMSIAGASADDVAFDDLKSNEMYDTALICANADTVLHLERHIDPVRLVGRRKLTHWAWELPVFPAAYLPSFEKVDEVWTASRYVARSVQSATNKVVRVVPYGVQTTDIATAEARSELKLPQDAHIFLTVFDINSFPSRKNPIAVVRAFRAAFPDIGQDSPLLVIKYHGRSEATEFRRNLAGAISGDPRIVEINAVYSAERMSYLRAACDTFVSLHRSEGFGLNIAEAMAAGNLAIATDFSGNEDYMNRETSIPIPFKLIPVRRGEYPHGAGQCWAEPDHDDAVEAMRWAVDHPQEAGRLAQRGKEHIRSNYSKETIAQIVSEALEGRSRIPFD
jgi:glycosyltransferase involved in cell wall biosynthesis